AVEGALVPSGVDNQPKSLEETVRGAINRAKGAIKDADYSFGLESGLIEVPYTKTGMMDLCVCAIYDGKNIHLGLSSAFELPKNVYSFVGSFGVDDHKEPWYLDITRLKKTYVDTMG